MSAAVPLVRRVAAEAVGTAALVAVVVGSGIQATELSRDVGVQLLANSLATVFGLGVLIVLLGPVSGAHFNPVVSLAAWWTGRRGGDGLSLQELAVYVPAQIGGAIGGAVLADAMFARPLVAWSTHERFAPHLWIGEVVATGTLILLIFGLARAGHARLAPAAVACWIGAAYWFTSSTSFAIIWTPSLIIPPGRCRLAWRGTIVDRAGDAGVGTAFGRCRRQGRSGAGGRRRAAGGGRDGVLGAPVGTGLFAEHGPGLRLRPAAFLAVPGLAGV
ncbi:aquaporin [Sphaerisporangium sp. NPDC051017]|uniref:aquaporin n=1 Tax=Sphaerisporangium sp. NPDC051017 TaxID=3154636 RepID=UPI003412E5EA